MIAHDVLVGVPVMTCVAAPEHAPTDTGAPAVPISLTVEKAQAGDAKPKNRIIASRVLN
jgi:hypothetical protein